MSLFKSKKNKAVATPEPVLTPAPVAPVPTDQDASIREAVRMDEIRARRRQGRSKTLLGGASSTPSTTSQTLLGKW